MIFDEPTTGLDPIQTDLIMKLLEKIREDRIIILTTHSMEEAEYLGDRMMILKDGNVVCIDSSIKIK